MLKIVHLVLKIVNAAQYWGEQSYLVWLEGDRFLVEVVPVSELVEEMDIYFLSDVRYIWISNVMKLLPMISDQICER